MTLDRAACFTVLIGLLGSCASSPEPTPTPFTEGELRKQVEKNSLDPWPHYALALLHENRREYEDALREYGQAINLLPARKATRPVLKLGILHHRMNNYEPALRCYEEVLSTIASESETYLTNDDFKSAAVGAKVIFALPKLGFQSGEFGLLSIEYGKFNRKRGAGYPLAVYFAFCAGPGLRHGE